MEKPDITQNVFPEFNLFGPRIHPLEIVASHISRVLHFAFDLVRSPAEPYMSEHNKVDEMLMTEDVSGATGQTSLDEYWDLYRQAQWNVIDETARIDALTPRIITVETDGNKL